MNFKAGISRWFLRFYVKMVREKASPEYIARGWAIGMFYGCAIPFGLQLILSIPTSFVLRGSKIGATLGTLITNHVTVFFIYPLQCYVGSLFLPGNSNFAEIRESMLKVAEQQSFSSLLELTGRLVASFFVGGILFAAIMTPLTYWGVLKLVNARRERKLARRLSHR